MRLAVWDNKAEYLNERHFLKMLLAALCLHILLLAGWNFMPGDSIEKVPVRTLNIKLGNNDNEGQEMTMQQSRHGSSRESASFVGVSNETITEQEITTPTNNMQSVITSLDQMLAKKIKDVSARVIERKAAQASPAAVKQYVREPGVAGGSGGSRYGTSAAATAEAMARYEQMLSAWIQRFKIYPQEARDQGMMGKAILRIRIDRAGRVQYYEVEQGTGHRLLDDATLQMIKNANPVPPVPDEYPEGNLLEFKIPVSYDFE